MSDPDQGTPSTPKRSPRKRPAPRDEGDIPAPKVPRKSPRKSKKAVASDQPDEQDDSPRSWVFIAPESLVGEESVLVRLPTAHASAVFMIQKSGVVFEVNRVYRHPSSWFVGNRVEIDGGMYVATEIDTLFLLLPLLQKNRSETSDHAGYFTSLDSVLTSSDFPGISILQHIPNIQNKLDSICDVKDLGDAGVHFRLNDENVMNWLKAKLERLAAALDKRSKGGIGEARATALGIISEYIEVRWLKKLAADVGLPVPGVKTTSTTDTIDLTSKSMSSDGTMKALKGIEFVGDDGQSAYTSSHGNSARDDAPAAPAQKTERKPTDKLKGVNLKGVKPLTSFFAPKQGKDKKK